MPRYLYSADHASFPESYTVDQSRAFRGGEPDSLTPRGGKGRLSSPHPREGRAARCLKCVGGGGACPPYSRASSVIRRSRHSSTGGRCRCPGSLLLLSVSQAIHATAGSCGHH